MSLVAHLTRHCARPARLNKYSLFTLRSYATKNDQTASSLLSHALDQKQRSNMNANPDTVGPFSLGIPQQTLRNGERTKKWSELNTAGKVTRTAARTSNLTVILLGAGLSVLLVYSLTSELFSKNSATVLYNDACNRISASPMLSKTLHPPLKFHNNPPTSIRPRHRSRVTSQILLDSTGREHMFLHFYVEGSQPGSSSPSDASYLESFTDWFKEQVTAMSDLTVDDVKEWGKGTAEKGKDVFRYLSGSPMPSIPQVEDLHSRAVGATEEKEEKSWGASLFGALSFSSAKKGTVAAGDVGSSQKVWSEGEVHADLVRNNEGYFVFRYLLVDFPNSRTRYPNRVFVERTPGVRESEPVMRWDAL